MSDTGGGAEGDTGPAESLYDLVVDIVVKGLTVIFPFVVTIWVLKTAFGIVADALGPVVFLLERLGVVAWVEQNGFIALLIEVGIFSDVASFTAQIVAVVALIAVVLVAGTIANVRYGDHLIDFFDYFVGAIPGIGAIYNSFRQMGDAMLESDVENFRSVKLVEFPHDGIYVIGFETAQSPPTVGEAVGEDDEMVTMFLPLAPNPVMGGFLTHIPQHRISDVDMTVEEGVRSIITSGMATGEEASAASDDSIDPSERIADLGVTAEDLPSLSNRFEQSGDGDDGNGDDGGDGSSDDTRTTESRSTRPDAEDAEDAGGAGNAGNDDSAGRFDKDRE
ncbi:DUF502 domain-containing protein [Halobium salinum]|uniref:DUF502 domain-containing protein n=1 Tax=Halobium salinum TaxID=1364940 RepID=A0ABD5PDZ5_9EURY|nr:DUF502 domain-containing protein [Halobium salinum]